MLACAEDLLALAESGLLTSALVPSCGDLDEFGLPMWPTNISVFPYPPPLGPVAVQCVVPVPVPENFVISCPSGFEFSEGGDPACALACPPDYTDLGAKWTQYLFMTIPSWISFPFLLFLIVTQLLFPENRTFPRRLYLYLALSLLVLNLSLMIAVFRDWETCNCDMGFYCWLQVFLSVVGVVWASAWWMITIFHMWISVFVRTYFMIVDVSKLQDRITEGVYLVIGWGICLLPIITLSASDGWGAPISAPQAAVSPMCLMDTRTVWKPFVAAYGWITFTGVVVLILAPFIVAYINTISSRPRRDMTIRMIFYSGYYILVIIFAVTAIILSSVRKDETEGSFADYMVCKLAGLPTCPSPSNPIPSAINCLNFFLIGTAGLVLFISIGLSKYNLKLWGLSIQNVREGRSFFHRPAGWEATTNYTG
eukprot:CAMPEP_0177655030 /NCGR_PEP_ID=MMETSP0447-20121125/14707_1 /TAXON_ID=0 /ORGANISM="Stygamoeba regulata, Strain BSH-02190019" /LENGTH=423 /DNA_ID=CAMNT_0019158837 /DNA_START=441 /DNA_END=1709 /DNA_ORIENTATION=+